MKDKTAAQTAKEIDNTEMLAQELDNTNPDSIQQEVQRNRMKKLKENQHRMLMASKNWTEELESIDNPSPSSQ